MVRTHQPGEAAFRSILPEDIDWKPFAAFPPTVRLAVLVGDPSQPGPYVTRVKASSGAKLMPHKHPEDRIYTVMSGVFYIGLGDRFYDDRRRVRRAPNLLRYRTPAWPTAGLRQAVAAIGVGRVTSATAAPQ